MADEKDQHKATEIANEPQNGKQVAVEDKERTFSPWNKTSASIFDEQNVDHVDGNPKDIPIVATSDQGVVPAPHIGRIFK